MVLQSELACSVPGPGYLPISEAEMGATGVNTDVFLLF
jgi:hypothetical protein